MKINKIIACFLTAAITVTSSIMPIGNAIDKRVFAGSAYMHGKCGENAVWSLEEGVLTVSGTGSMSDDCSLLWQNDVTSVIIKEGITGVGSFSSCDKLVSVTLPESTENISDDAFSGCTSLKSIKIPESVTYIGTSAFASCTSLENIELSGSINNISNGMFSNCTSLSSIEIPDGITAISKYAFSGCTSLKEVILPDSLTSIGYNAFAYTPELNDENGVKYVGTWLVGCNDDVSDITVKNGIKTVSEKAFYENRTLKSITFSDTVEVIKSDAFRKCAALENIRFGKGTKVISGGAFSGCKNIEKIIIPESVYYIGDSSIRDCEALKNVTIENPDCYIYDAGSVISNSSFYDEWTYDEKSGSYSGDINGYDDSTAEKYAVKYGYNFKSLGKAPSVTTAPEQSSPVTTTTTAVNEYYVYYYQPATTPSPSQSSNSIEAETALCVVGNEVSVQFDYTANYNSIIDLTWDNEFLELVNSEGFICYGEQDGKFSGTVPSFHNSYYEDEKGKVLLTFRLKNSAEAGKTYNINAVITTDRYGTDEHEAVCEITAYDLCYKKIDSDNDGTYDSVEITGGDYSEELKSLLHEFTIPEKYDGLPITSIGNITFYEFKELASVKLPETIEKIGNSAFYDCTKLESINIPDNLKSIGNSAFCGCTSMKQIILNSSIENIGSAAFKGCYSLIGIELPDSLNAIDDNAFYGCSSLSEVKLGNGIESIGNSAFSGCSNLNGIDFPDSLISIGDNAFYNCRELTGIVLNEGVESIGNSAFNGCTRLENIKFPDSIKSIGSYTFSQLNELKSVDLGKSIAFIDYDAFYNCKNLEKIVIGNPVCDIYDSNTTICNMVLDSPYFTGTIYGYNDSTAQDYALKYDYKFSALPDSDRPIVTTPVTQPPITETTEITETEEPTVSTEITELPETTTTTETTTVITTTEVTSVTQGTSGYLSYAEYEDHIEIIGCDADTVNVEIPETINSLPVKVIGERAFYECSGLETITIPSSVQKIRTQVGVDQYELWSGLHSLKNVTVSEDNQNYASVDGILFSKDMKCFLKYPAAKPDTSYTIPDGVERLGCMSFERCNNLISISMPDTVKEIEPLCFPDCASLEFLNISENVSVIWGATFRNCSSLRSLHIPANLEKIEFIAIFPASGGHLDSCLTGCSAIEEITVDKGNKNYYDIDGVLFDSSGRLISYPPAKTNETYKVPEGTKEIFNTAFRMCKNLKSIELPKSVESILYDSLSFYNAVSLEEIKVSAYNEYFCDIDGILFSKNQKNLIYYPVAKKDISYTIPDSVSYMPYCAFSDCIYLKEINIPDKLDTIPYETFLRCLSLESVIIPKNIKLIESGAFADCKNLKEVIILNPECKINGGSSTINNYFEYNDDRTGDYIFEGTIYGYSNSTAQEFAEKYGKNFVALDDIPPETTAPAITAPVTSTTTTTATTTASSENTTEPMTTKPLSTELPVTEPPTETIIATTAISTETIPVTTTSVLISTVITDTETTVTTAVTTTAVSQTESVTTSSSPDISLSKTEIVIKVGEVAGIYVKNYGGDIKWVSDDTRTATISDGIVTAVSAGKVEIYAITDKGVLSCTVTVEANVLKGDISGNNKIDLYDAIEIAKSLIGTRKFTDEEKKIADFNGDGKVDLYDAIGIAKYMISNK